VSPLTNYLARRKCKNNARHQNVRNVKSSPARRRASECSHFRGSPSFSSYLAAIKISSWYLKWFKSYCFDKHTPTHHKETLLKTIQPLLRCHCPVVNVKAHNEVTKYLYSLRQSLGKMSKFYSFQHQQVGAVKIAVHTLNNDNISSVFH